MSSREPLVYSLQEEALGGFEPIIDIGDRWMELPHADSRSRGFILVPGEEVTTPGFLVDPSHRLYLQAMRGGAGVSGDGLELRLWFRVEGQDQYVGELHIGNEQDASATLALVMDLRAFAGRQGRLVVQCRPGSDNDPRGDWAALLNFAVAPADVLDLAVARSQATWRGRNEGMHFVDTYDHALYQGAGNAAPGERTLVVEAIRGEPRRHAEWTADHFMDALRANPPDRGEMAFLFANRLLHALLPVNVHFGQRLEAIARRLDRPVRVLSLCAGEARVESGMLSDTGVPAEVTLVDLAPSLLLSAGARFPPNARVRLVQGAVEDFDAGEDRYDIVLFVSGLHHVVELEAVTARIARALVQGGEFWLIGEQVGPNGNRLWPDAARVAGALFANLPERLRRNRNTGQVDARLPDLDFGSSCFEGIRSQDIPLALARHFAPVVEDRRNCFLWRLIDLAYEANYAMDNDEDVEILTRLVAEEYAYYANGGIGCEINGVYRSKLAR